MFDPVLLLQLEVMFSRPNELLAPSLFFRTPCLTHLPRICSCGSTAYAPPLYTTIHDRDQAEVKRLERAKSKAEAVSRRHLDELALIRRLQRQKVGVGRKQKLTVQERETKKLLDAKVPTLRPRLSWNLCVRFESVWFGSVAGQCGSVTCGAVRCDC